MTARGPVQGCPPRSLARTCASARSKLPPAQRSPLEEPRPAAPPGAGFQGSSWLCGHCHGCHTGRRGCGGSLSPVTGEAAGGTEARRPHCPQRARDAEHRRARAGLGPLEVRGGHGGSQDTAVPPHPPRGPTSPGSHLKSGEADGFQHVEAEGDAQRVLEDPGPPGRQSGVTAAAGAVPEASPPSLLPQLLRRRVARAVRAQPARHAATTWPPALEGRAGPRAVLGMGGEWP